MVRFKLHELIEKKEFSEGRRVTIKEVAYRTGINRMTLSKILHHRGYSTTTGNINRLCEYFKCELTDLMEFIPQSDEPSLNKQSHKQQVLQFNRYLGVT